jgi:hypothetical protein
MTGLHRVAPLTIGLGTRRATVHHLRSCLRLTEELKPGSTMTTAVGQDYEPGSPC